MGYGNMVELCRLQAVNQRAETIKACKNLAQTLRTNAYTSLSRSIGYVIERVMLKAINPDDPGVKSRQMRSRLLGKVQMCAAPSWQTNTLLFTETDQKTLMNWVSGMATN